MIYRLHELLKEKEHYALSISLWPIEEVDLWIRDQSDSYELPKNVFHANEASLDTAILKAITFLELAQ